MGMIDSTIYNARLLGWALLFSAVNGAVVLAVAGLAGASFHWYDGLLGGAVIGAALTLLFETPLKAIVRWVIEIPYFGWAVALPFILTRFVLSWPGVAIANQMMTSRLAPERSPQAEAPPRRPEPQPDRSPRPRRAGDACERCDGPALARGNGRCSTCHGSGKEANVMHALAASVSGASQDCRRCGGNGRCVDCGGKGYFQ